MIDEIFTPNEVAKILKISRAYVYKLVDQGRIACIIWKCEGEGSKKKRNTIRFKQSDVMAFIENHHRSN